jgi:hypothetical protein
MVTAHTGSAAPVGEASLEDPNAPIVIIGQVLCLLVPLAVWFIPSPLEPVTQHAFAIVGFMVVAWITRAMDYALAGFLWRSAALPTTRPGSCSAPCSWA